VERTGREWEFEISDLRFQRERDGRTKAETLKTEKLKGELWD
jgi:hypothetical protein